MAHTPEIGTVIDEAMRAIEKENTTLKNVLPKNYASPDLDKRVLGDVVDLFTNMDMGDTEESKDLLGRTYEYCIQQFAACCSFIDGISNSIALRLACDNLGCAEPVIYPETSLPFMRYAKYSKIHFSLH